jgi:hypothetical protein
MYADEMYHQDDHTTSTVNSTQLRRVLQCGGRCGVWCIAYIKDLEDYSTDGHNSHEKPAILVSSQLDRTGHE